MEVLFIKMDSDGDGTTDINDDKPKEGRLPHRYWRIRNLAQKNVWNIKELQFFSNKTNYNPKQDTIASPESSSLHNKYDCIRSGQYLI